MKIDWSTYINKRIEKKSGKPFKSGLKIGIAVEMTINPHKEGPAFLMNDGSIVNCEQCKLKV